MCEKNVTVMNVDDDTDDSSAGRAERDRAYDAARAAPAFAELAGIIRAADGLYEAIHDFTGEHDAGCLCPLCSFLFDRNHIGLIGQALNALAFNVESSLGTIEGVIPVGWAEVSAEETSAAGEEAPCGQH